MSLVAQPLATAYKNQDETGYKIGVSIIDEDGETVTIPAGVVLIYYDTLGVRHEIPGARSENIAYYEVLPDAGNIFSVPGTYRYWMECFELDRYGPFELKILAV